MNHLITLSAAFTISALSSVAGAAIGGPGCLSATNAQPVAQPMLPGYRGPAYRRPIYPAYGGAPYYGGPGYYSGFPTGPIPNVMGMPGMGGFPGGMGGFPGSMGPWGGSPFGGGAPWDGGSWGGPWGGAPWGAPYPAYVPMMNPVGTDPATEVEAEISSDADADEITLSDSTPSAPETTVDTDQDGVFNSADLCPNTIPTVKVDKLGCAIDAHIVLEGVKFHTDSAKLTPESIEILNQVANTLTDNPEVKVEVAGHTDSDADDAYNLKLSQSRAETVVKYLTDHGVTAANMTAKGYGETQPLVANDTPAHKATNRRVELRRL